MDQKELRKLVKRRHPGYEELAPHWAFLESCYKGGREWFKTNIFKYLKEGVDEYEARIKRAFRFNHTREVVDLVDKYLFKADIFRNTEDASKEVQAFWKAATKNGLSIDQYARQLSRKSSIFGSIWVAVDATKIEANVNTLSVADMKGLKWRPYSYTINPERVLDFSCDNEEGDLNWILYQEQSRDAVDPFTSTGNLIERFRLWTRTQWMVFEVTKGNTASQNFTVELVESGNNPLNLVPVFRHDVSITDEPWCAPSLIGDIAYLDRAVANYLSNLDAIIQDQTFSQLVMPAQGLMPGDSQYDELVKTGTNRIFVFDSERGGSEPKYIAPDPKQASVILGVIAKIINEIYHTVGMAGERTKQDNAVGIDNSSGVAKAFDFERINALLVSKAAALELTEARLVKLVNLWAGNKDGDHSVVEYAKTFDVRGLSDELQIAAQLSLIEAPDEVRREHMRALTKKLFPMIEESKREKIEGEIKQWPPEPELPTLSAPAPKRPAASGGGDANKNKGAVSK